MYLFLKSDLQYFKIVVCRALFQYAFEDTAENNRGLPACPVLIGGKDKTCQMEVFWRDTK